MGCNLKYTHLSETFPVEGVYAYIARAFVFGVRAGF